MITTPTSPFAAHTAQQGRLHRARSFLSWDIRHGPTFGNRRLRFPLLSLQASQELGPCRHALSQRTVAGFMTVHFPPPASPTQTPWPASPKLTSTPEDPHA